MSCYVPRGMKGQLLLLLLLQLLSYILLLSSSSSLQYDHQSESCCCSHYRYYNHDCSYYPCEGNDSDDGDNNNNIRIQRRFSRFFTISSQRCELSPTRTLKWPRRNRVQTTCNTSSAYHAQQVVLRATWYEGTAQLLSMTELKSHLF